MLDQGTITYIAIVGGCGLLLLVIVRLLFHRAERRRLEQVDELTRFVAIKTPSDRGSTQRAKKIALKSIATRFGIIRGLTIPALVVLIGLLIGVPFFGDLPTALVTLLVTAATIVLGIAAKPVLENIIAGMMISFGQPIRIGDLVGIEGHYTVVEQINLTHTIFKLWDFRRFVVSNSKLIQSQYINYTLCDRWLWARVEFRVAYDTDLDLVEELALRAVRDCPQGSEREPGFWIMSMDEQCVQCWVAGWVDHPLEAWGLRHDLAKRLVKAFQRHGIRAHLHQVEQVHGAPLSAGPPQL